MTLSGPDPSRERRSLEDQAFSRMKSARSEICALADRFEAEGIDTLYRFYHQSFKVYRAQELNQEALDLLRKLRSDRSTLSPFLEELIAHASPTVQFAPEHNRAWVATVGPFLTLHLHLHRIFVAMRTALQQHERLPEILDDALALSLAALGLR